MMIASLGRPLSPAVHSPLSTLCLSKVEAAFAFERLLVYEKAISFADRVCEAIGECPRAYYSLVDQLNRSSLSIARDLAEGNGPFTKADRKRFFSIARGPAQECVPLLELARRRVSIAEARYTAWRVARPRRFRLTFRGV